MNGEDDGGAAQAPATAAETPADFPADAPDARPARKGAGRGVETMFRTVFQNHIALTQLADVKANIMISINGMILSVTMAVLVPRLPLSFLQALPFILLLAGCVSSLLFAILAARPRVTRREITVDQVRRNEGNLLFFGNFLSMSEAAFEEAMGLLLRDRERLYANLTRDLYGLGRVLDRKYRLLRRSYTSFAAGLTAAAAVFLAGIASP